MVLDENLRSPLHLLVFRYLGAPMSVARLAGLLGPALAARVPAFDQPFQAAKWAVEQALAAPHFGVFTTLVRAVDPAGTLPPLIRFVQQLETGEVPWVALGGGERLVVDNDQPFVDREPDRAAIEAMVTADANVRCVSIQAGSGEGKSWLLKWFREFAPTLPNTRFGTYQVDGAIARYLVPGPVATSIALDIGLGTQRRPRRHEDPDRWAQNLAVWLVRGVRDTGIVTVVALDGFAHPQLPEAIHTFVRTLIEEQQKDAEAAACLRVVLLGYDEARLRDHQLAFESRILEYVDQAKVEDWLRRRVPGRPDFEYEEAALDVVEQIPDTGPTRMRELCTEVRAAARLLGAE